MVMPPFSSGVFPIVGTRGLVEPGPRSGLMPVAAGTKGVRPVIGPIGERPGDPTGKGVYIVPGIIGMFIIPESYIEKINQMSRNTL